MATIYRKPDESIEEMLRRFKKATITDGTLIDGRKHEYYIAPSLKKKLKSEAAEKRRRREARKLLKYTDKNE